MGNWEEKAKNIQVMLQQNPEYRAYMELEQAAQEAGLFAWEERLKQMQQDMTIALDNQQMDKHCITIT